MKLVRYFTQNHNIFLLSKCNLINICSNRDEIIYRYQYYNNKNDGNNDIHNYFTIKINEFNNYTFIKLNNLCQTNNIIYLDSYLHFFNKYHNNIVLYSPNLQKIYDELSYENITKNNNKFLVYNLNKLKYSNIIPNIGKNWFYH